MRSFLFLFICMVFMSCSSDNNRTKKVIFLHHSTGKNIWLGSTNRYIGKLTGKSDVKDYFRSYNRENGKNYSITERNFPRETPYGWKNYPYDYYNIWVKHAGNEPYMEEPTLEMLTRNYDVIVFKHCYPTSNLLADSLPPNIDSEVKTVENYKLQYNALKEKMHSFPDKKFIVWTPAIYIKAQLSEDEALRTRQFYDWVVNEWDEKGDNIFLFDFYKYETEGGLFMNEKNADGPGNSHPGKEFSARMAPVFAEYIIRVIEGKVE